MGRGGSGCGGHSAVKGTVCDCQRGKWMFLLHRWTIMQNSWARKKSYSAVEGQEVRNDETQREKDGGRWNAVEKQGGNEAEEMQIGEQRSQCVEAECGQEPATYYFVLKPAGSVLQYWHYCYSSVRWPYLTVLLLLELFNMSGAVTHKCPDSESQPLSFLLPQVWRTNYLLVLALKQGCPNWSPRASKLCGRWYLKPTG